MEYFVFYLLGFVLSMLMIHIMNVRKLDNVDIGTGFMIALFSWVSVMLGVLFLLSHYGFFDEIDKKFRGIK